jgi:PTS system mannose-specific IID component
MQNIGFAFALMPLIRERTSSQKDLEELLTRNLQMFNTHPYLSASLIGSIVRMEEDRSAAEDASSIMAVKQNLMGPYAAIGDTFFWGALRPCAGIFASVVAWLGLIYAPLVFMSIFAPICLWVRLKGFVEGYQRGKQGIEFIRRIDLPKVAVRVRWLSVAALAACGFWLLPRGLSGVVMDSWILLVLAALAIVLLCWLLVKKGVSQVYILYGVAFLLTLISLREFFMWWK